MLVINIEHFLDDEGDLIQEPKSANRLARYIVSIVEASTKNLDDSIMITGIKCRRRPKRKSCKGILLSRLNPDTECIEWTCTKCGDCGTIYSWKYTEWDLHNL